MEKKSLALLLVCLLSCDYINGISASIAALKPRCCSKFFRKRIARQAGGCRLKPEALTIIEGCVTKIKQRMPESLPFDDHELDKGNYLMHDGMISGLQNFKITSIRCSCGRGQVRLFIKFSFLRILVTFLISLLEGLLGGLLGALGTALTNVLGNVVNLLVRVLAVDIVVQITILQKFSAGSTCIVESYRVSRLETITLLGLDLQPLVQILSPLLTPVLDLVFQLIFNGRVKQIFVQEFGLIAIPEQAFTCGFS